MKTVYFTNDIQPTFKCPYCLENTSHKWKTIYNETTDELPYILVDDGITSFEDSLSRIVKSKCNYCGKTSLWIVSTKNHTVRIYPSATSEYPEPHKDMPDQIKKTYIEAGSVMKLSLGSSAALSRLTLENLLTHLGYKEKSLNQKIGAFISKEGKQGFSQKILDVIRVYGNSGAHSGIINIDENPDVPMTLLKLINIIVEQTITIRTEVDNLYASLPTGIKDQIDKRDL